MLSAVDNDYKLHQEILEENILGMTYSELDSEKHPIMSTPTRELARFNLELCKTSASEKLWDPPVGCDIRRRLPSPPSTLRFVSIIRYATRGPPLLRKEKVFVFSSPVYPLTSCTFDSIPSVCELAALDSAQRDNYALAVL